MSKLRDYAKGRDCQVRIVGVCNGDSATTVLAHLTLSGISGRGLKAPDQLGAWCCSECHRCVDSNGTSHKLDEDEMIEAELAFLYGIMRTQYELIKRGLIK